MAAEQRQPLRVVLDSQLRMSPKAKMLALPGATLVVTASHDAACAGALRTAGADVQVVGKDGRVDLAALMKMLAVREVNEILVEAGATLAGALLEAGLVDELVLYQAPCLLGDAGRGLFRLANLTQMAARPALEIKDMRAIGQDWRLVARIVN